MICWPVAGRAGHADALDHGPPDLQHEKQVPSSSDTAAAGTGFKLCPAVFPTLCIYLRKKNMSKMFYHLNSLLINVRLIMSY